MTGKTLIVDDRLTVRMHLAEAFRAAGLETVLAATAAEARLALARELVALVVLDVLLPDADGLELLKEIKLGSASPQPAVLLLSTESQVRDRIRGLPTGADDYVGKPYDTGYVIARARALLVERARAVPEKTSSTMVEALEQKNSELSNAYAELKHAQTRLVQAAKLASLGELVAGVAHEINNPLAFVISHLGTASKSVAALEPASSDTDRRNHWQRVLNRMEEMGHGLDRIRELVLKLRTFSRLDEGERKIVDVQECVDSVLTILGHRLRDRIDVQTRFAEPARLDCFPSLLNQALMNLVANAIDAIEDRGQIVIEGGGHGALYVLTVGDSGSGIPEALRERIFDPFFTTKDVGKGTGLGLSITYSIVKKHGGTLELRAREGGGTLAELALPIAGPPTG